MTSEPQRPVRFVDVFASGGICGNPLAVVHDAAGMSGGTMQSLTRWFNLSETSFLLPPTTAEADYKVRIFTLGRELPFAGHPTLGTAKAFLDAGGVPRTPGRLIQECGAGLIEIRIEGDVLAFAAPPLLRSGPIDEALLVRTREWLGLEAHQVVDAAWVDNGPGWYALLLDSAQSVLAAEPRGDFGGHVDVGLVGPHAKGHDADFEVRALFSGAAGAVLEDPVTGSLNASLAQWLFASGRAKGAYVAAQGTRLDRKGRVRLTIDEAGQVWVGGEARVQVRGALEL
jgi:PhzF family phenazine biosynthesis protein